MKPIRILVVEDESIVAMDIKHRLESLDYEVPEIISSGEEAVVKAKETQPDLVLMDIVLKGEIDGIDAAQLIKDKYDIPVVYLTAYSDEKTLKRAKITGPFGYIIKPFEDRELHSAIEIALYKHKMESKLKRNEMWLSTTLESIGDAVITTDKEGYITFMNPIAQKITEWDLSDALGKPLGYVFKIIDEKTRSPIKDSVKNMLLKNDVAHLKDHSLLITKSGTKIPINNTSAPIKDYNDNINGIVLVFQDISERRKSEKEREELLKESARSELFGFLLSAMPVFASNIPPQIRNNIAKSFGDRFEINMKPRFEKNLDNYSRVSNNFEYYLIWISEFLSNLGIETEVFSKENTDCIRFLKCPWEIDNEYSPMFCLICRVIIMRSFTWANIKGNVEQTSCVADGKIDCVFEFCNHQNINDFQFTKNTSRTII